MLQLPLRADFIMLVSDSHKFVFFHFPKTAGSSITHALAPYLTHNNRVPRDWHIPPEPTNAWMGWQPNHHIDLLQHSPVIKCNYPYTYFKASFVRNPYDLVVSAWHNKEQPFTEFVIKEVATRKNVVTRYGCQLDYLSDDKDNVLVDWIGRFENIALDWKKFCYFTKIPWRPLKKHNTSWKEPYQEYYTERTFRIVANLFEKDIKHFGYTLDK